MMKRNPNFLALIALLALGAALGCKKDNPYPDSTIRFAKRSEPVWEGKWTAADPSIYRDGDTLRMYYSSFVVDGGEKLLIAGATSLDGLHWRPANGVDGQESIALDTRPGAWDNHLESVSVLRVGSESWLYYCGYPEEADVAGLTVAQSQVGLAKSTNHVAFTRSSTSLILERGGTNAKDNNSIFSPTVILEDSTYYMLYVGYCIDDCKPAYIGILGATSVDGETWTKQSQPVLAGADQDLKWADVIKEPAIVKGPDGIFYLFISGDESIGIARSANVLGPYEVYPYPILWKDQDWEKTSVIAPTVLIENGKARMWYMGVNASRKGADFAIGYAEAPFPFTW